MVTPESERLLRLVLNLAKRGERSGRQALYRNRSAPELLYRVPTAGKWTGVFKEMEAGGPGEVHCQAAANYEVAVEATIPRSDDRTDMQRIAIFDDYQNVPLELADCLAHQRKSKNYSL
jgi:hypothetical protein